MRACVCVCGGVKTGVLVYKVPRHFMKHDFDFFYIFNFQCL